MIGYLRKKLAVPRLVFLSFLLSACGGGGGGNTVAEAPIAPAVNTNAAPVADAGLDQNVAVGARVTLDGSDSSDADGDVRTYSWTLTSRPPTSAAVLSGSSSPQVSFVADVAGAYEASLVVSDGSVDSRPASIIVLAGDSALAIPARRPSPLAIKQIHSGHSLTDAAMFAQPWPGHSIYMWAELNPDGDYFSLLGKSTIPGSSMGWRWNNPVGFGAPDARQDIADWELLVITERVSFTLWDGTDPGSAWYTDHLEWMRTWVEHAWSNGDGGNGIPTVLYASWTDLAQGETTWRAELDTYHPLWEQMADYGAENLPEEAYVYIIPANLLMMRLFDDIAAGVVPDVASIYDFFSDTIHPNGLGSYAIALLHMAVIHHTNPSAMGYTGYGLAPEPSAELAGYLQTIVWEIATGYERAGVPDS